MAKSKSLGRVAPNAQSAFRLVDPALLIVNPENERDYTDPAEGLEELYNSIKSEKLKTPLQVYEDGVVHDGNRRLTVLNRLREEGVDIGEVPVIIVPRPDNEVEGVIARLNTNEAKQFSPLAQAKAFAVLRASGMNNAEIAKRSPFTAMHVGNMLTLADASDEVKAVVRDGAMSATLVVETIRAHGEDVVLEAVTLAHSMGKDRATQRHVDLVTKGDETEAPSSGSGTVQGEAVTGEVVTGDVVTGETGAAEGTDAGTDAGQDEPPFATGDAADTEGEIEGEPEGDADDLPEGDEVVGEEEVTGDAATPTPAAADPFKFTAAVGKSIINDFLRHAAKFEAGKLSAKDFKDHVRNFMSECETYGLKLEDAE